MASIPGALRPTPPRRQPDFNIIHLLKAGAAQLIVLHHLVFYGPMADHARALAPRFFDWLGSDARIVVQVFLVIGGFLAARSLAPQGLASIGNPGSAILRRYARLAPPFFAATLLAVAASAWARMWMTHDSISASPGLLSLLAHLLFLHSILGLESVSAGAWYVAIDFQLYTSLIVLLWLCSRLAGRGARPWLLPLLVAAGVNASLLFFNRNPDWDAWAPYFFGSYGLGILAWWAGDRLHQPAIARRLMLAIVLSALAALLLDFRSRIAMAVITACFLVRYGRSHLALPGRLQKLVAGLGRISYGVFLIHFPVCLVINAGFTRFLPPQPLVQGAGMLLAWGTSLLAGLAFERWVQAPLERIFAPARTASAGAGRMSTA